MLYSSSPGLTWFSCPGTSLCWCGRAGLWWHSLQDSPAAPGSGSPWKQRTRLWRCNSQWHQGWLTRPGQSSGKQCGHSAAPASLAGMLWWSEEEESLKRRKKKKICSAVIQQKQHWLKKVTQTQQVQVSCSLSQERSGRGPCCFVIFWESKWAKFV